MVAAVILALLVDGCMMIWMRRGLTRRGETFTPPEGAVMVLGYYSPVLTWLKGSLPGERTVGASASGAAPAAHSATWEWLVITLAVILFCLGFLNLGAETRLTGNEAEVFQALDWTLVNSLRSGHFPLWNPSLYTGLPYVADPMLHLYNPVVTLPVLLLGVRAGFKLGVFLSFLIAALGMWRLSSTLGMSRAARVWTALLFAFAGQPVARFFQGQYLFVLGFAWLPWIISALLLLTQTRRRRYIVESAVFMALLFFSGNAYYPFFALLMAALLVAVMLGQWQRQRPVLRIDLGLLKVYLLVAVLALGMIAIQLLPLVEFWPRMGKDLNVEGSHTLEQIYLDYTSKDPSRPDAYSQLPAREEFYAYIGLAPLLALSLLPLAFWKRPARPLIFFLLLLLLALGWITLEHAPWGDALLRIKLLYQFRHLLRALIFGSLAIIALAGLGIDTLWTLFENLAHTSGKSRREKLRRGAAFFGLGLLGVWMLLGLGDVFSTNRVHVRTQPVYQEAYQVMNWLRQYDQGDYYVRYNPQNSGHDAVVAAGLRFIDVWYHFADIRDLSSAARTRPLRAQPHYVVQLPDGPWPEAQGAWLVANVEGYNIFYLPESLPMAFTVTDANLRESAGPDPLIRSQVSPLSPFFSGPNDIEVIAAGGEDQTLVVLVTHYPGWRVEVDGDDARLKNVGGYLAVDTQPGVHKYTFAFRPRSFFLGLFISLTATAVAVYLFCSDVDWQAVRQQVRAWAAALSRGRAGRPRYPSPLVGAVYRQGVLQLDAPLPLAEDAPVRLLVQAEAEETPGPAAQRWLWATSRLLRSLTHPLALPALLFAAALLVYLTTRLVGLENWPIYFFTDEAVHTMLASDLVRDGFENYAGDFLPAFFENGGKYRLGFSVYLHVLPYLLFGKSLFVTRATSALITLLCAGAIGLTLRKVFRLSYWWSGVLFLSIIPAWFLHSRTAFEYAIAVTLYSLFLYFYFIYRTQNPRRLYLALIFGALAVYSYSPVQMVVVVSGVLLALIDVRYHWQNRAVALRGVGLLALLALPYLRFALMHPDANYESMRALGSYWLTPLSLPEKLGKYLLEYAKGINPLYWFLPNLSDLNRHLMKGYGNILLGTLPFFALGLAAALRRIRLPEYRILLVALLAAPTGTALVALGITRALVMVVPVALLTALGAETVLKWLEKLRLAPKALAIGLFAILSLVNFYMLGDALKNGPTWYEDYSLGGMQYGGKQLFTAVLDYAAKHPDQQVLVTPDWANGPDVVARFFAPEPMPFSIGAINGHLFQQLPLTDTMVFVMTPQEYDQVLTSGKFQDIRVEKELPYPNGETGFYFVRLRYVDNIAQILQIEAELRRHLNVQTISIDGEPVEVGYSLLDMGEPAALFDGDPHTVARTLEANPLVVELAFSQPRDLSGLTVIIGSATMNVTVTIYAPQPGAPAVQLTETLSGSVAAPQGSIEFGQAYPAQTVRLEFYDLGQGEPGHVHIWEITLR